MKIDEAIEVIRRHKYYISLADFAKNGLNSSADAVKKRITRKSELKYDEIFKIAKGFDLSPSLFFKKPERSETITIDYYENNKIQMYKNPSFKNYYMDRELARSYNPEYKDTDFKIICALDDKLDGGVLWLHEKDVLLLDTTYTDVTKPGMYVYECEGGRYIKGAIIEIMMDGNYKFSFSNPKYQDEIRTPEFLKKVEFKIVGRIIRNLMFFA